MHILLSRHGNTFGPKDKVVWAGISNDLSLVEEGLLQAKQLASQFILQKTCLAAIYCAPLQRTRVYASTIAQAIGFQGPLINDSRLNEIDYGPWTGLSNEEITQRFGKEKLKAWNEEGLWPTLSNWGSSESQIQKEVKSFLADLFQTYTDDTKILVITSNGRLRYFLKLHKEEFKKRIHEQKFKVKTGHVCKLIWNGKNSVISYWNQNPTEAIF